MKTKQELQTLIDQLAGLDIPEAVLEEAIKKLEAIIWHPEE